MAVGEFSKGDYYILIPLCAPVSLVRPKNDFPKLIGTALLVATGLAGAIFASAKLNLDFSYWLRPIFVIAFLAWLLFSRVGRQLVGAFFVRRK
ncbi:MAG: hypothetical protein ACRD59_15340 [Candidatus Acidiferrales bacterium]